MSVLALAIVNNSNSPILVRTRDPDSLDPMFKLNSALDVVDEKLATCQETFLGVLSQSDNYKIYGLCSATQTKILLMVNNVMIQDNDARSILRAIHNTYVDVTTNDPFYTYGQKITSKFVFSPFKVQPTNCLPSLLQASNPKDQRNLLLTLLSLSLSLYTPLNKAVKFIWGHLF